MWLRMLGLLSRATANLKNRNHPAAWSPDDPAPAGFAAHKHALSLPISSLATLSFRATGIYSQGTVAFERADGAANAADPPSYGQAVHESGKPREEGTVQVHVEARTNSEGLHAESRIEPVEGHERCGLSLTVRFLLLLAIAHPPADRPPISRRPPQRRPSHA